MNIPNRIGGCPEPRDLVSTFLHPQSGPLFEERYCSRGRGAGGWWHFNYFLNISEENWLCLKPYWTELKWFWIAKHELGFTSAGPFKQKHSPSSIWRLPPPCTGRSYFGPGTAPVHRFTDPWSSFRPLRVPWASKQQQGECPSTPSTSAPHSLALIPKPLRHILGTFHWQWKHQRVPTPQPNPREIQKEGFLTSENSLSRCWNWASPVAAAAGRGALEQAGSPPRSTQKLATAIPSLVIPTASKRHISCAKHPSPSLGPSPGTVAESTAAVIYWRGVGGLAGQLPSGWRNWEQAFLPFLCVCQGINPTVLSKAQLQRFLCCLHKLWHVLWKGIFQATCIFMYKPAAACFNWLYRSKETPFQLNWSLE